MALQDTSATRPRSVRALSVIFIRFHVRRSSWVLYPKVQRLLVSADVILWRVSSDLCSQGPATLTPVKTTAYVTSSPTLGEGTSSANTSASAPWVSTESTARTVSHINRSVHMTCMQTKLYLKKKRKRRPVGHQSETAGTLYQKCVFWTVRIKDPMQLFAS